MEPLPDSQGTDRTEPGPEGKAPRAKAALDSVIERWDAFERQQDPASDNNKPAAKKSATAPRQDVVQPAVAPAQGTTATEDSETLLQDVAARETPEPDRRRVTETTGSSPAREDPVPAATGANYTRVNYRMSYGSRTRGRKEARHAKDAATMGVGLREEIGRAHV